APVDEQPDVTGPCRAIVDDEIAVGRGHCGATNAGAFKPGAIDECAGRPWNAVGHNVTTPLRILKHAACARSLQRLGTLSESQGLAGDSSQPSWLAITHPEIHRQDNFACVLQTTSIVAEGHLVRSRRSADSVAGHETNGIDELADQAATKMRV